VLNGNTVHPAVMVLDPWTENLRTLRLISLGTGPTPGWYTTPMVTVNLARVALWHGPSVCRLSVTSGCAYTFSLRRQKSRYADDIGERYKKIKYRGGKLIYYFICNRVSIPFFPFRFRTFSLYPDPTLHNRLFSEPSTVYIEENTLIRVISIAAI